MVMYFLAAYQEINLPRYLMHHLCWAIKEGIKGKRKKVPCGRLLSEIFHQGGLLETLKKFNLASDRVLGTTIGNIINGKTLQNMKIIGKFSSNEKDLKESSVPSGLMRDFPRISKEDNLEVLTRYIAAHAKESGATSQGVVILTLLMMFLSESRAKGPRLILTQKLLVLRPKSRRLLSLKQLTTTVCLLVLLIEKEVKEILQSPLRQLN